MLKETKHFKKVWDIIEKYDNDKSKLIPILQEVQEEYRYLPEEILTYVATTLDISCAKVFGVATFYSHFALKPKGKYVIKICDGTACHVKGSRPILEAMQAKLGLSDTNNTTNDLLFTIETVSCLGACGLAPVIMVNENVHGEMTPVKMINLLDEIMKKEEK
jgi:NADH-quinone oxidoreductase subunit E